MPATISLVLATITLSISITSHHHHQPSLVSRTTTWPRQVTLPRELKVSHKLSIDYSAVMSDATESSRHVLLGGTGAVGTVVADSLIRAGQHVTLLLKPKHAERLQRKRYGDTPASLALYDHNKRQQARLFTPTIVFAASFAFLILMYDKSLLLALSLAFLGFFASFVSLPYSTAPFRVVNKFKVAQLSSESDQLDCDYLWLCIAASDVLQHSDQLGQLLSSLPSHVVVITVAPLSDMLLRLFPHPERLVQCMCAFLAYQAPLMGEEAPSTHQLTAGHGRAATRCCTLLPHPSSAPTCTAAISRQYSSWCAHYVRAACRPPPRRAHLRSCSVWRCSWQCSIRC